jgi:hypothetical protein
MPAQKDITGSLLYGYQSSVYPPSVSPENNCFGDSRVAKRAHMYIPGEVRINQQPAEKLGGLGDLQKISSSHFHLGWQSIAEQNNDVLG